MAAAPHLPRGRHVLVFFALFVIHRCINRICVPLTLHSSEQHAANQRVCQPGHGPRLALLMVVIGHANSSQPEQLYLSIANKKAYSIQQGFPLYLLTESLGTDQHPVWDKLVAIQAVFQHSCADYVWVIDSDTYVMNLSRSVLDVVLPDPRVHAHSEAACNTSTPDIIAAGACMVKINGGSIIWRNSDFSKKFLDDTWHSKFLARPVGWREQAAIWHMYKQRDHKQHVCIVKARTINAYPNEQHCHDGYGTYKDGDLIVHFPGGLKKHLANPNNKYLRAVRAQLNSFQHEQPQASWTSSQTYTLGEAHSRQPTSQGRVVHVPMRSSMYTFTDMPTDLDVLIEPQAEGFTNLGWPTPRPKPVQQPPRPVASTATAAAAATAAVAVTPQFDAAWQMLAVSSDLGKAVGQLSAVGMPDNGMAHLSQV